jgi:hypothetical protein
VIFEFIRLFIEIKHFIKENLQMSKKLLSEAQVRRFQALATISPINEMAYSEEETMEGAYASNEEMVNEEEEMDMAPEAPEMDADEDMDAEAEADVEMDEELVEKFMDAVSTIQLVADALGGKAGDMDMDADEEAPMDMDADEEAPLELDAGDEEEPEEDEEAMLQEALRGVSYVPSQKEIVKTVAKRVAKRLQEAKNAQAKLDKALGKK